MQITVEREGQEEKHYVSDGTTVGDFIAHELNMKPDKFAVRLNGVRIAENGLPTLLENGMRLQLCAKAYNSGALA